MFPEHFEKKAFNILASFEIKEDWFKSSMKAKYIWCLSVICLEISRGFCKDKRLGVHEVIRSEETCII